MAKIALFGDSYISHLERFCSGDLKIPGDVRFFGVGGMNFENYSDILKDTYACILHSCIVCACMRRSSVLCPRRM